MSKLMFEIRATVRREFSLKISENSPTIDEIVPFYLAGNIFTDLF